MNTTNANVVADNSALLAISTNQKAFALPPGPYPSQVASTAMFGIKAVLDGNTKEVVALLRDNFLR